MEALIGHYDYYILGVILLLNGVIWFTKIEFTWKGFIPLVVLFVLVLPYYSILLERQKVFQENEIVDGFNLIYLIFRWPIYLVIGFIQISLLMIRNRYLNNTTKH